MKAHRQTPIPLLMLVLPSMLAQALKAFMLQVSFLQFLKLMMQAIRTLPSTLLMLQATLTSCRLIAVLVRWLKKFKLATLWSFMAT